MMRIVDDPSKGSFGYSATVVAWNPDGGVLERLFSSPKLLLYYSDDEFEYGDEFLADVKFAPPSESSLSRFDREGIAARCSVSNVEKAQASSLGFLSEQRHIFSSSVNDCFSFDGANQDAVALVRALVVGDRQMLFEGSLYGEIKVVGLAHLVAVSGAHLVIVLGMVSSLTKALRAPRALSLFLQLGFLIVYLIMVGLPISCIRAALMASVGLLSFAPGKRSYALSSLGVAIIALLSSDPFAAFSVSFGLSALSTLGIILFAYKICSWLPFIGRRFDALVTEPLAMTCAALLLTFPLSVSSFSQFSVISPISNVVAVPLVTVACGIGVLAFIAQPIAPVFHILIFVSYYFSMMLVALVGFLSSIPFVSIPVDASGALPTCCAVLLCLALWVVWPRRFPARIALCTLLITMVLFASAQVVEGRKTSITMLDVGQGDSFVLKSKGATVLIDTGNDTKKLYAGLARNGITHLDGIVVSHADDDHCGCIEDLHGIVSVDSVYIAKGLREIGTPKTEGLVHASENLVGDSGVRELSVGDTLNVGALALTVISPAALTDAGENDDSLCLLGSSDLNEDGKAEWRFLFAGDAESEVLDGLLENGLLENIDILKVSHHGAKRSLDEGLIETLQPEIALISVGEQNRYGHPAPNALSLLESCDANVFRTDIQGDVVCNLNQDTISVQTMK